MMEKPLALTDPHINLIPGLQMMTQQFAVPEGLRIAQESRSLPEILADGLQGALR